MKKLGIIITVLIITVGIFSIKGYYNDRYLESDVFLYTGTVR